MGSGSEQSCRDKEHHSLHICDLTEKGRKEIVESLTGVADVKCGVCGIKANFGANVCDPVQLPELDWLGDGADNVNA